MESTQRNLIKPYDLEERTFQFAKCIRLFLKSVPKTIANIEDGRQLINLPDLLGLITERLMNPLAKKTLFSVRKLVEKRQRKVFIGCG